MDLRDELLEIKALIDKLRATDTELRVFGADSHHYRIGSPLSETEIQDFESVRGIRLPEDYRLYLRMVGNGSGVVPAPADIYAFYTSCGAGPYYGLYPLASTATDDEPISSFPYSYEEETRLRQSHADKPAPQGLSGLIEISDHGCQGLSHLVVNGLSYGTIWTSVDRDDLYPEAPTFRHWMRKWVEGELSVFANKPLAALIELGMSCQQVVALTGADWTERNVGKTALFENSRMRVQLVLDDKKTVSEIRSYY